jgi:hypothetical protein
VAAEFPQRLFKLFLRLLRDAMNLPGKARFVQIAVALAPRAGELLDALEDSGGVWCYRDRKKKRARVSDECEE